MCISIGIEDLVANALIESLERSGKREVLFRDLDKYGAKVIKVLDRKGEQAVLIFSRESTTQFLRDYSNYFEAFSSGSCDGIRLKPGVSADELWRDFRGYLSTDVMLAFMDDEAVQELGVSA